MFGSYYKLATAIAEGNDKEAKSQITNLFYYLYNLYISLSSHEEFELAITSFMQNLEKMEGVEEETIISLITTIGRYVTGYLFDEVANLITEEAEFNNIAMLIQLDLLMQYCLIAMAFYDLEITDMYTEKDN
jgi:hypothetical protein